MKQRKGLGKGKGMGYKNIVPIDSHIHSLSAKGVKLDYSKAIIPQLNMDAKGGLEHDYIKRAMIITPYWDKRLEGRYGKWMGGTRHFRLMPIDDVNKLVDLKYLELEERQNESPTTETFIKFMTKWKKYDVTAHGYAVSKKRDDKRVTIEGLEVHSSKARKDPVFVREWFLFNRFADELDENRSWWD